MANTLTFLGYQPVWQDIFGTEGGDLRSLLRQQIDQCKGVVQLIGNCYGAEPPDLDEEFGRISYTQYEALYARKRGKKVWYLFIDENFPTDPHEPEPPPLAELQQLYRHGIQTDSHLFHPLASREALEASVLKLRDDLTRLRRGVKQWAAAVGILLLIIAISVFWLLRTQHQTKQEVADTKVALTEMTEEMKKLRQSVVDYPKVEAKVRQSNLSQQDPAALRETVYAELSKEQKIDPETLRNKLPQVADQLKTAEDVSTYERATAAYVAKDYREAERLALAAAAEAQKAAPQNTTRAIEAFQLAGWAAQAQIEYSRALEHFRAAERFTDRNRAAWEWTQVQFDIGAVLWSHGQYPQSEAVIREVAAETEKVKGPEHLKTLMARNNLGVILTAQGKAAEAEKELRAVLALAEKTLGSEDSTSLAIRQNFAATLTYQLKFDEAEKESREVLALTEKVFGPDHRDTLKRRMNLAILMAKEGKNEEAERDLRIVIKALTRLDGAEHPDTLYGRMNLALALNNQRKYNEGETEGRDVLAIQERVLGPEHPMTLRSRASLALCLKGQRKNVEALELAEQTARIARKVLGPTHPDTKMYEMLSEFIRK